LELVVNAILFVLTLAVVTVAGIAWVLTLAAVAAVEEAVATVPRSHPRTIGGERALIRVEEESAFSSSSST
jgi:hypothetical protein